MNKSQLIDSIAEESGLTRNQAKIALEKTLSTITEALTQGQTVQLIGFGSFKVGYRAERIGRNPQTGEPIKIGAVNIPVFLPGKCLKSAVR
jgi:DNA-binding protein HU-alpha